MNKEKYDSLRQEWIEKEMSYYIPEQRTIENVLHHACGRLTQYIADRMPELRRVAGFYNGIEHWWLVDYIDGKIVDPTKEQFSDNNGEYSEFNYEDDEIKIGRCLECGEYIYGKLDKDGVPLRDTQFCNNNCSRNFADSLKSDYENNFHH